jgi:hypothetical protein
MGFIDRAGQAFDTAVYGAAARHEAKKFARSVKLGKPYWTKTKSNQPYAGNPELLEEHVFTRIGLISGTAEGAAELWLQCGPVYADRNASDIRGLQTLREYSQWVNDCDAPNEGGDLHAEFGQPKRGRRAA